MENYKWNILGLAEMRWTKLGEEVTEKGHKIWFKGEEKDHVKGVGFVVQKDFVNCVIDHEPI